MIERHHCPVCSAPSATVLLSVPYSDRSIAHYWSLIGFRSPPPWPLDGIPFCIQECHGCGALFQRWALTDAEATLLYGVNEAPHRPQDSPLIGLAHQAQDVVLMRQLLPQASPRILDFGMGWGRFALMAQAFGCQVSGVEVSETTREHARAHGIRLVEEASLEDNAYDFVIVDQVFEHLVDPAAMARRLTRCLKPGGLLLCGVPGHRKLPSKLKRLSRRPDPAAALTRKDLDAISPLIHLTLFNTRSLRRLGQQAGLQLRRPSPWLTLGAGALWNRPRQWNRHFLLAWKYWRAIGTRMWFQKPANASSASPPSS